MHREVNFQLESIVPSWASEYDENKFTVADTCFLSTRHNSHELNISKDVLEKCASSILGNFLVAKMIGEDASTHLPDEVIFGYFPKEQEIRFEDVDEDGETITKAHAYAVLSKMYGKQFNKIFMDDNLRKTSVEMTVETPEDDEHEVLNFDIFGLTCLGKLVTPSCSDAEMSIIRFSADDADEYFKRAESAANALKQFADDRKKATEAKSYKIDKSKESVSNTAWGDVDKAAMRDKIMKAKNRATLVKSVYMLVEEGWEEAPSEHLKYPVMELKGDTFVYNSNALSSALGYAKKENETSVVSKVEKIQKKLGLGEAGSKEGQTAMAKDIEFAAVNIDDLWSRVWNQLREKYPGPDGYGSTYRIQGIYEDNGQKFAVIIESGSEDMFRLNFRITEDGYAFDDEITKVVMEVVETDDVRRFAEPDDAEKYKNFEKEGVDMTLEEMQAKCEQLERDCEDKDNIIMEKDQKIAECEAELAELREFKAGVEKKELAAKVEATMEEIKDFATKEQCEEFRKEGMECDMASIDAWCNKVKASCFETVKAAKGTKKESEVFSFAAPTGVVTEPKTVWDKL